MTDYNYDELTGVLSVSGQPIYITGAGVQSIGGKSGVITLGSGLTTSGQELLSTCSTVSVASTGTSTDTVNYITIDGVEKKLAGEEPPVTSVNTKTGDVVLSASDVGALPDTTSIPTKTSDLTNDSDFVTSAYHDASKQNTLTAGTNITLTENTISATDTTYTAGTNISISADNKINSTVTYTLSGTTLDITF